MENKAQYETLPPTSDSADAGSSAPPWKANSSASMSELRDFLQRLQGKSPNEVLGVVSESGLVRATTLATVLIIVLLVVFTVIPYVFRDEPARVANEPAPATATDSSATAADDAQTPPASAESANSSATDLDRAVREMGIGDSKEADPQVNPLEDNLDNLLDGVK